MGNALKRLLARNAARAARQRPNQPVGPPPASDDQTASSSQAPQAPASQAPTTQSPAQSSMPQTPTPHTNGVHAPKPEATSNGVISKDTANNNAATPKPAVSSPETTNHETTNHETANQATTSPEAAPQDAVHNNADTSNSVVSEPEVTRPAPKRPPHAPANRNGVTPVVSVHDLTKIYTMGEQKIRALNGVNFDLWPGEMVAVMGPSGSGKSTFMNIIGCLDVPTSGTYLLDNIDVSKLNDTQLAAIRGGKIGFVFQSFNLLPRTTAVANVELPLIYAGVSGRERRKRAVESLTLVGLGERVHHKPNELSGGQQQRVAIARALVNRPALILADEPTGNLDTKTSQEIMELFQRLSRERNMTILLITHEPEMAEYCDRVINIRDGVLLHGDSPSPAAPTPPPTDQAEPKPADEHAVEMSVPGGEHAHR